MYLTYPNEATVIKYDNSIQNLTSILTVVDDASGETPEKYFHRSFAYSRDDGTYSAWIDLSLDNLNSLEFTSDTWFKFKFEVVGQSTTKVMSVESVTLTYTQEESKHECTCKYVSCSRIEGCCGNGTFDPYDLDQEKQFYVDTNEEIESHFGIEVDYWKLNPQTRSGDVIFKEWSLSNVSPSQKVKLLVDRNEFPDSKINYNIWGMDYEDNFEVSIMKTTWESIFGAGTLPQKGDFMYMSLNGRMYEIKSSYLFRGFMQMGIWYKCALTKYQPKLSNIISPEVETDLTKYVQTTDEMFSSEVKSEEIRLVKPTQFNTNTTTTDLTRKGVDNNLLIVEYKLQNDFTLISEHYYNLSKTLTPSVVYQENVNMSNERAFSCWFKPTKYSDKTISVNNQVPDGTKLRIYQYQHNILVGDLIKIMDYQNNVNVVTVTDSNNDYFVINYSLPIFNYKKIHQNILFSGGRSAFSVEHLDTQLNVYLANTLYTFNIPALDETKWYSIMINMSNSFKQLNLNLWTRSIESVNVNSRYNNGDTHLVNIFENTISITDNFNVVIPDQYWYLTNMDFNITNIRLLSSTVEKEKQNVLLSQNIIQDGHNVIIADNALPRVNIVKISKNL